jgi:hypothetical protein
MFKLYIKLNLQIPVYLIVKIFTSKHLINKNFQLVFIGIIIIIYFLFILFQKY